MRNCISFLLITLLYFTTSFSQNLKEIDSLNSVITNTKNDSVKVLTLNKLAFIYIFNDIDKAKLLLNRSEKIALKTQFKYGYNDIINTRGIIMDVSGNSDSAYYYFNKCLQLGRKNKFKKFELKGLNNLGMYFWNSGQFNKALQYFFDALKLNESTPIKDQIKYATCYNNIGLIYQELDLNEKALQYHKKAYELRKNDSDLSKDISSSLNNIGICYHSLGKNRLAIDTYKEGLLNAKMNQNQYDYFKLTENIGNALQSENRFEEAIQYYLGVESNTEKSPKISIGIYSGLVAAYNELNQPTISLKYAQKGLEILKKDPELRNFSSSLYEYTAQSHYMLGNIKKGEAYNNEFLDITKVVFSENISKQIANYEIKYETAKKEKLLAENKIKMLQDNAEKKQIYYILLAVSFLAISIALIGLLIYRQQKLKNKQQEQEFQLKSAISKIETQSELQEQRLSISRDLHDNIGAQLTFIISSVDNIKYAFDIQNPKLDSKLEGISNFTKSTIVELRDTIWAMNNDEITFEELRIRIFNFIENAKEAKDTIEFKFIIDEGLNPVKFSSISGMNIYRTIQEAVNNSIKYANANQIYIEVKKIDSQIAIFIQDNGIGIDKNSIQKGYGLINMEKRIEAIGGIFKLESNLGKGTTIELLLNQNNLQ